MYCKKNIKISSENMFLTTSTEFSTYVKTVRIKPGLMLQE